MQDILDQLTQSVGAYVPSLIGALIILIIGWIVALIAAGLVRGVLRRTRLDRKLANWFAGAESQGSMTRLAMRLIGVQMI